MSGWRGQYCRRATVSVAAGAVLLAASCADGGGDDREEARAGADGGTPPEATVDHWHAAYGVYVCGEFLPDEPEFETELGIHSHGDGIIHIHPFSGEAAGRNATLGVFLTDSQVKLDDGELRVDGERHADGDDCDGRPGVVQVAYWADADELGEPQIVTTDLEDLRFRRDGQAFTIAFVPDGADIPPPPSTDRLADLDDTEPSAGSTGSTGSTEPEPLDPRTPPAGYSDPALAAEVLGRTPPNPAPPPAGTPADLLDVETLIPGEGEGATNGDLVTVHYVGVLADGTLVDESWSREPFPVTLGQGSVIPGWEEGLLGAKIGERRRLVLGAGKAYGSQGAGNIPADAPLAFEIDIVDISR